MNPYFIVGYIVLVLAIGYLSSRKQSGSDFMIAERKLSLPTFVSTTVATFFGSGALVAYTAYVYEFGIGMLSVLVGLAIGYIVFGFAAKKIHKMGREHNFHTIADYFHYHFKGKVGHVIAVIIGLILITQVLNQMIAGTQILSAVTTYGYEFSLLISSGVILFYLILGGFRSVVRTDVFQYLVMIFLIFVIGGSMASETSLSFSEISENTTSVSLIIAGAVYGFLFIWYSADLWQRIYAAKDIKTVRVGMGIAAVFLLAMGLGITLIASSTRAFFPDIDPAQALVFGIQNLLSPTFVSLGVIMLFAAIMSSADTLIFVLASSFSKDGVAQFKGRKLNNNELRFYTRISLIGITLCAAFLAYFFRSVIDVTLVNAGLGMAITPAIVGSLKWKLNPYALTGSIIFGIIYVIAWIIVGNITPQTMVSTIMISAAFLLISQKVFKYFK
jgi:solute:Na+ symporter, SSS family